MLTYWEDELIQKTKNGNDNKLIFVENLKMFVENNKDKIKFVEVMAKTSDDDIIYTSAETEDGITYHQVEKIDSKEKLMNWYNIFSFDKKVWSYKYMNGNLPKLAFNYISNILGKDFVKPPYKELCSNDEELFNGFSSTYFNGYSFNNADP